MYYIFCLFRFPLFLFTYVCHNMYIHYMILYIYIYIIYAIIIPKWPPGHGGTSALLWRMQACVARWPLPL